MARSNYDEARNALTDTDLRAPFDGFVQEVYVEPYQEVRSAQSVLSFVETDKLIAEQIKKIVPQGQIYSYRTDVYVANRTHPFTINFYLGDRIVPFDVFLPDAGFLVVGQSDVEAFKETYPTYEIKHLYDSRHRSCDDHKIIQLYQFRKIE